MLRSTARRLVNAAHRRRGVLPSRVFNSATATSLCASAAASLCTASTKLVGLPPRKMAYLCPMKVCYPSSDQHAG